MSHLKSIGIDVGVIAKGLNYKVSLFNERLQSTEDAVSLYATDLPYSPTSLGNFNACGCGDVDTAQSALDRLAQIRAETHDSLDARITSLEARVQALENA